MATHVTRSQACALQDQPPLSPRYNPLSVFESNWQGAEVVNQVLSFSACRTTPQAPQDYQTLESETPDPWNPDDNKHKSEYSHCSVKWVFHTPTNDGDTPGDLEIPGGGPPDDDNPDFNDLLPDPDLKDNNEAYCNEEQPQDPLVQLAQAIQSLTRTSHHLTSDSTPHTKVQEPNQFDRMDPCKLQVFLIQCKLNFQDHPRAFSMDHPKVTFAHLYLKGMALEWFKPNLLQMENPTLCSAWMDNFHEFILELQTNFGPHNPVGDAEYQLDHLMIKDGQHINKYVVEFNHIASQVCSYGEDALWHHFYNGLPNCIKDEISCVRAPSSLAKLQTLAHVIQWPQKPFPCLPWL